VEAARPEPYEGKVVSISGEGDSSARTFPVRVEIPNDGALRAGMTASSKFALGTPRKALLVSKDALILEGGRSFVFVVTDGAAQKKPVETGAEQDGKVEVLRGLAAGEKVVVRGNERLQPGAPVRLVGPPPAEAKRN
jgi:RND family efflux transporter MFP subunit